MSWNTPKPPERTGTDWPGFTAIAKLRPYCEKWGGKLIEVTPMKFKRLFNWRSTSESRRHTFEEAPFVDWHGVVYDLKHLYVVPHHATANGIIHEMGHVFASEIPPENADEAAFLGWEACLALHAGVYREWSSLNDSYGLGDLGLAGSDSIIGVEWGETSAARKARALRESIMVGQSRGIITPELEPRSLR